ncbi:MAG TPA: sulfatase [Candidatus Polarisedimenticolia bacterium]|jgi:arylsulfatase A-like enzyme
MTDDRIHDVRRFTGWIVGAALCAAAAGLFLWLRPPRVKTRPSFLVIAIDSVRADHVGAYGYPRSTTPRIDALARDGILFEEAYSQAPWTKPSVASIFTSSYTSVHHVLFSKRVVNGEDRTDVLNAKFLTLAEAMKSGGWATGGFGQKIHLRPEFGFDQGFDRYDMHARRAENINRRALDWLRSDDPDRFFMYLHYNDPHYPYKPHPEYARFGSTTARVQIDGDTKRAFREGTLRLTADDIRQLLDLYDGEILYADTLIGELLDRIGGLGYHNVTVIVTADHGEEFLDHGDITHGQSLYGELVRVPFIIGGSGLPASARGRRSRATVELIDIMPTLLEMAGLPRPPDLQGRSLAPLLAPAIPTEPGPVTAVFSERRDPNDADFSSTVFDGRWKFIHDASLNRVLLFDIETDPGEKRPMEGAGGEIVGALRGQLERWAAANRTLHDKIRPEDDRPLDPETERRLRSLGYVQ